MLSPRRAGNGILGAGFCLWGACWSSAAAFRVLSEIEHALDAHWRTAAPLSAADKPMTEIDPRLVLITKSSAYSRRVCRHFVKRV